MKIQNFDIQMFGKSDYKEIYKKSESLKIWNDNVKDEPVNQKDIIDISEEGKKLSNELHKNSLISSNKITKKDGLHFELSSEDKAKIQLIQDFVYITTGKKVKFYIPAILKVNQGENEEHIQVNNNQNNERVGWGIDYQSTELYKESEQMSFKSSGIVTNEKGEEISFNININLSREFTKEEYISFKAGDALIDPLVINFDTLSANLSKETFSFDINTDGSLDEISFVEDGSGFLVLDKNDDGIINNGLELFGPQSGNGFKELATYDLDGNNWIDENDHIFESLKIWTKDENGNDKLFALSQKGVGAIYLGNVDTNFSLKNSDNTQNGEISKTGIYLKENGGVSTIQHLNLSV